MPARIYAEPPKQNPIANIIEPIGYTFALCIFKRKVVKPNPSNPRGAALAVLSLLSTLIIELLNVS